MTDGRSNERRERGSFFATLKKELINRRSWPTKAELRTKAFDYIEVFYNRERRDSTL